MPRPSPTTTYSAILVAAGIASSIAGAARADVCDALSYRRNSVYKEAGYCFKTAAQIRIFGNAGCQYDRQADVPLSDRERDEVASIVAQEREAGCR